MSYRGKFIIILFLSSAAIFKASTLYAEIDAKVNASVGQSYDDNITYSEDDRQSDLITLISLDMILTCELKKLYADLKVSASQELFWEHTKNNNTSEEASLYIKYDLSKYDSIILYNRFSHTYEPRSFEEEFARVGGRYSYYKNRFDIGYNRDFTEQFSAKAGYGFDIDLTTRGDLLDSYVNRAFLEGDYAFSSKSALYGRYEFLNRILDPGGSASVNTVIAGLKQSLTEQLEFEGRAGIDFVSSYNGDTIVRPLWAAALKDQINENISANIAFTQRYSTNPYTADVFNNWNISGGVAAQLMKRLSGQISLFYGRGEYDDLDIKDNLFGGGAALMYEIFKNIKCSLSYDYSRATSNIHVREYNKNTVLFKVFTEF